MAIAGLALVCGCASVSKGPSDDELIQGVVSQWKTAAVAKDLDKVMALYSEEFQHYEYGDKSGFRNFLQESIDMGYLENLEIEDSGAKTSYPKQGQASVYPIEVKGSFGTATIELILQKESGNWRITGMDMAIY